MQAKHLIIIALAGIVALIGFNIFNSSYDEQNGVTTVVNDISAETETTAVDTPIDNGTSSSDIASSEIIDKPLGEQPKAILDNAAMQIEQVQKMDQQRLEQMSNIQ